MKKFVSILIAALLICTMLPLAVIPAMADTKAYPYPGNYIPEEGYYYIRNVGADSYLGAEDTSSGTRFHIQSKGDLFQIKKTQLSTEENVYAYQLIYHSPALPINVGFRMFIFSADSSKPTPVLRRRNIKKNTNRRNKKLLHGE